MFQNLKELYKYRALVWALVLRHLAMRYRGSVLGFLWSFLNPLCLMGVYVLVFRYYVRFNGVENYTVFVFCGLLPWLWLSSAISEGTTSIVSSGHLITKSMFPPQVLPIVSVLTSMIHYLLSLPILFLFMLITGVPFHATLWLLPLVLLAQFLLLYGLGLLLSSLNVYFRDVQHIVGNLITFLFFLCPILYPPSTVPSQLQFTLEYNPLALLTRFYQQVLLYGEVPSLWAVGYFGAMVILVLVIGQAVFQRYRESFAELL